MVELRLYGPVLLVTDHQENQPLKPHPSTRNEQENKAIIEKCHLFTTLTTVQQGAFVGIEDYRRKESTPPQHGGSVCRKIGF
jgi:hypothetical protein